MPNSVLFPLLSVSCLLGIVGGLVLAVHQVPDAWNKTALREPGPNAHQRAIRQRGQVFFLFGVLLALLSVMITVAVVRNFGLVALFRGPAAP